jgi:hypothetical protein
MGKSYKAPLSILRNGRFEKRLNPGTETDGIQTIEKVDQESGEVAVFEVFHSFSGDVVGISTSERTVKTKEGKTFLSRSVILRMEDGEEKESLLISFDTNYIEPLFRHLVATDGKGFTVTASRVNAEDGKTYDAVNFDVPEGQPIIDLEETPKWNTSAKDPKAENWAFWVEKLKEFKPGE